ncbi:alpha/beta hydrolase [Actinomadura formosensis]|uniref:alpha/beta hydrolase n=1 Tax=Actinomadura formosensis TaxID=60706 RepID=UPI0008316996|nr:alpha/beta hydrolase-fold protein [Actinomadura formosensis]
MTPPIRPRSHRTHRRRSLAAGSVGVVLVAGLGAAGTGSAQAAGPVRADDGARITAEKKVGPRTVDITIASPALGKSVKTRLLLPANWRRGAAGRWPVLYAFHGGRDNYTAWTGKTDIEAWAARYNVLVVMPEGENGSYTDWYNYGKGGTPRWETFHTAEVRQLVERNYGAGARRAALGISSGGAGAMAYAARHQGMFKHVASLSGVLSMRSVGIPAMLMFINAGIGQDPFAIWGIPGVDDANWAAHDPYALAPGLRGTRIFFSTGTTGRPGPGDPDVPPWDAGLLGEAAAGASNKDFQRRLDGLKIPYTAHFYGDGRHNWPAWTREAAFIWPALMKSIDARRV